MKEKLERLEILAAWMKDYKVDIDSYTDGALEREVKYQKEETIQCIGDMLEEILSMDEEQIKKHGLLKGVQYVWWQ